MRGRGGREFSAASEGFDDLYGFLWEPGEVEGGIRGFGCFRGEHGSNGRCVVMLIHVHTEWHEDG
jgi:hypothetical protein